MECINMFNQDIQGAHGRGAGAAPPPAVSPRISFSNDFSLDASGFPSVRYERPSAAAAAASSPPSDFEFSVGSHSMMAADELFSRGRLRPLREQCAAGPQVQVQRTTLRDELLSGEGERELTFSPSSSSGLMARVPLKWKTLIGLRKGSSEDNKHHKETR